MHSSLIKRWILRHLVYSLYRLIILIIWGRDKQQFYLQQACPLLHYIFIIKITMILTLSNLDGSLHVQGHKWYFPWNGHVNLLILTLFDPHIHIHIHTLKKYISYNKYILQLFRTLVTKAQKTNKQKNATITASHRLHNMATKYMLL